MFRSRIEAKWAEVFDQLKWKWEYEPFDLEWYIPDFIITFANGKQLLVEVKGDLNIWEQEATYQPHVRKIFKSGWKGAFVVVGSNFGEAYSEAGHGCPLVGIGGDFGANSEFVYAAVNGDEKCGDGLPRLWTGNSGYYRYYGVDEIVLRKNGKFWSLGGSWMAYDIGWYPEGMKYHDDVRTHWKNRDRNASSDFERIWTDATNKVQWPPNTM